MLKRLATDVSTFSTMINDNYLYVDKTQIIHQLISRRRLYFLSRPRRFGKSLLISTLKELFSGNKELFKDTWIHTSSYAWTKYPVIHLDFSSLTITSAEKFEISLAFSIDLISQTYGIDTSSLPQANLKLKSLVTELSKENKVAILIDEYDYALLKNLNNTQEAEAIQKIMHNFFTTIKSLDAYVHAIFITGVTKFAKTSVFSGMNNLNDLTLSPEAATLLGYTHDEIINYFEPYIADYAQYNGKTSQAALIEIKEWYNGYRFSESPEKVYNPFSIVHCLDKQKLANYWLETGTPSFLVDLLKKQKNEIPDIETHMVSGDWLGKFDLDDIPLVALLFQAGYITIAEYDKETNTYKLTYPNNEVRISFTQYIIAALTENNARTVERALLQLQTALNNNNIEQFCTIFRSLLANIPYQLHIARESYYHSILQFLVTLLGIQGESEISSNAGRMDMVISTKARIFIFEFKFETTGQQALQQIIDRRYYEKYLYLKKPITLVGISFNFKDKTLFLDWVIQPYQ